MIVKDAALVMLPLHAPLSIAVSLAIDDSEGCSTSNVADNMKPNKTVAKKRIILLGKNHISLPTPLTPHQQRPLMLNTSKYSLSSPSLKSKDLVMKKLKEK